MRSRTIFAAVFLIFAPYSLGTAAVEEKKAFPITENVPHVWSGKVVHETTPAGDPMGLFSLRYHEAPEGESWGPMGSCVSLREVPEIGCLIVAWGIVRHENETYDSSSATFAHRLDDTQWFVAPPAHHLHLNLGDIKAVSVIVYRTFFKEHPQLQGRVKKAVEHHEVIRYSRRTIREVIFRMSDPAGNEMPYWFKLMLDPPRVIEKEERIK